MSQLANRGGRIQITYDASPYGLGAVLTINEVIVKYFASPLSQLHEHMFGCSVGSPDGQRTWECLAILVALRTWSDYWRTRRAKFTLAGDNITSLSMILRHKASGAGPNLIAKEAALLIGDASFRPDAHEHIPGVFNATVDALSRAQKPYRHFIVPPVPAAGAPCAPAGPPIVAVHRVFYQGRVGRKA